MTNKELERELKMMKAKFEALEAYLKVETWTEEDFDNDFWGKTFKKKRSKWNRLRI